MLYHVSIEADDPQRVADVFSEFWGGVIAPFPPVADGSWIAFAGDDRNTAIEVYPRGTELHRSSGDAVGLPGDTRRHHATHIAIGTSLSQAEVLSICRREGWPAKYCKRGGAFGVIEIWIEGCQMVELLTPTMQREYLAAMSPENFARMVAAQGGPKPEPVLETA